MTVDRVLEVNHISLGPACSERSDLAAVLSDFECAMPYRMTASPSCETELLQKSASIDLNMVVAFHKRKLVTINVQEGQESQSSGTKIVGD